MLFYQTELVLIEVFEYILIIKLGRFFLIIPLFVIIFSIKFRKKLLRPLFYIIESIERVHELDHGFGVLLRCFKITLYEVGKWHDIENVLIQLVAIST